MPVEYEIKITLKGSHPPIWRRVRVPGKITLFQLHQVIQLSMGWREYHLHEYRIHGEVYSDPSWAEFSSYAFYNDFEVKLQDAVGHEKTRFRYLYDFGDGWEHILAIEKIIFTSTHTSRVELLDGKRACPPEDVGGIPGYEMFLGILSDPLNEDRPSYLEWAGGVFDPEAFDLRIARARVASLRWDRVGSVILSPLTETGDIPAWVINGMGTLAAQTDPQHHETAANLPLRRNMVTLLTYLRDNRVTGTQSRGNLQLKTIRLLAPLLVDMPELDTHIGDREYKLRSEEEVWAIFFPHMIAEGAGFIEGEPGRRIQVTPAGETFLQQPEFAQVLYMLQTWWAWGDWLNTFFFVSFPVDQSVMAYAAQKRLLASEPGETVPIEYFVHALAMDLGLGSLLTAESGSYSRIKHLFSATLFKTLKEFGAVEIDSQPDPRFDGRYLTQVSLRVTPFGRVLLSSVHAKTD